MNELELSKIKKVHVIGIGGIGVSAVARMFFEEGKIVTGNDTEDFHVCQELRNLGIPVYVGVEHECIPSDTELIVYSRGWDSINPEFLAYAKSLGKPMFSYPETLKVISSSKYTIAVSGAHGKTTTTAMTGTILLDSKKDPTIVVGSIMAKTKSNFVAGKSKYFVVEADEYRRSFLNLYPAILVITNIDDDHLDYYKDMHDIQSAFRELAFRVPKDGYIICNPNDSKVKDVIEGLDTNIIDYTLYIKDCQGVKGEHNRSNAACAYAVARMLGVGESDIKNSIEHFQGTWRRFEYKGKMPSGALVYDDYAHHPTEVRAALRGAREQFPERNICVIFQPHLYSRTKDHLDEFADVFANEADMVLLMPILGARELFDASISSDMLAERINSKGGKASIFNLQEMEKVTNKDTLLITMGAGDAYKAGEAMVKEKPLAV